MTENQHKQKIEDQIKDGQLDDILAQIDAEYAAYKQTPVFTCQEEELAFWSRSAAAESDEIPSTPSTRQPGQ
ncbi:MAG: hypothetical protein DWI57_17205 [Chloroflexi bacterium]|nr:MAG: hypothetical protein DWI57_17205 [Chloroflexota bacterium]